MNGATYLPRSILGREPFRRTSRSQTGDFVYAGYPILSIRQALIPSASTLSHDELSALQGLSIEPP